MDQHRSTPLAPLPLPHGINENYVDCPTVGLNFHVLDAGYSADHKRPLVLLLHGYPELAFSWRKVIPAIASAGYHVIAPDQRGYGRTAGWDYAPYDAVNLSEFTMTSLVQDMITLVYALGYREVACVIGHDFGALTAAMCAVMRPDIFKAVVAMSHPFSAMPSLPFNTARGNSSDAKISGPEGIDIGADLAKLTEPRKHYKWDNSKPSAADEWKNPPRGLKGFLRGYFYVKSAEWPGNQPHALEGWTAEELAKMPWYYIMPLHMSMPAVIDALISAPPSDQHSLLATNQWLSDEDLNVYVSEWSRTGFQGALNWYRVASSTTYSRDLNLFANKLIEVPARLISGAKDWGNYQRPGVLENMEQVCSDFRGRVFVDGAGHWPQQEQPQPVIDAVLGFLDEISLSHASTEESPYSMR